MSRKIIDNWVNAVASMDRTRTVETAQRIESSGIADNAELWRQSESDAYANAAKKDHAYSTETRGAVLHASLSEKIGGNDGQ